MVARPQIPFACRQAATCLPVRGWLLGCLLGWLLAAAPPAAAAIPLDPASFTAEVAAALNKQSIPEPATVAGPLTIKARAVLGTAEISLDNLHHRCVIDTALCPRLIEQFVTNTATELRATLARIAPATLRIVIKTEAYARNLPPLPGGPVPSLRQGLPPGLVALLYADLPESVQAVSPKDLQDLHLTPVQAFALATRNTEKELGPSNRELAAPAPGKATGREGGFYESSRLFMHDEWSEMAKKFGGHLLMAVPSSSYVVFADGSDPASAGRLSEVVATLFKQAEKPLSPAVFEWRPEGWAIAVPDQSAARPIPAPLVVKTP